MQPKITIEATADCVTMHIDGVLKKRLTRVMRREDVGTWRGPGGTLKPLAKEYEDLLDNLEGFDMTELGEFLFDI